MTKAERDALRTAFADFRFAAGCGCCGNADVRADAEKRLAKLLKIPRYKDRSGYDFARFVTKRGDV